MPTEDASVRQFWVLVNCDDITETNMPSEGVTTFEDFRLKTMALIHSSWNAYIFVRCGEAATANFMRFYFAKSSTGLLLTGRNHESSEPLPPAQFIESAVIGTETKIVPFGTAADTGADVLSSQVTPINGVISRMNTNAVLSYDGTPLYSWALDADTGKGYEVVEQAVPAGTVGSTEILANGEFSSVSPVNAFWSIKTTRKTTTLSNVPDVKTVTRRTPVNWPAILNHHSFLAVYDQSYVYWHKELNHMLLAAYTGDVLIEVSTWWQKSAPAPLTPVEMMPTGIYIPRKWSETISIKPCLHPAIVVSEPLVVGPYPFAGMPNVGIRNVTYRVPATNYTTWPDFVLQLESDRFMGGYRCEQSKIFKPSTVADGTGVSISAYTDETYIFHGYT